jgi:hypothetical protein
VRVWPDPVARYEPTAHTSFEEMAVTLLRLSLVDPGFGLGMIVQAAPSQCIVSV